MHAGSSLGTCRKMAAASADGVSLSVRAFSIYSIDPRLFKFCIEYRPILCACIKEMSASIQLSTEVQGKIKIRNRWNKR
jgi:hypothetical protein